MYILLLFCLFTVVHTGPIEDMGGFVPLGHAGAPAPKSHAIPETPADPSILGPAYHVDKDTSAHEVSPPKAVFLNNNDGRTFPPPSENYLGNYTRAAVAADNGICSEIGRNVLIRGGNAVDAAIATVFCIGIMDVQSSGIGGGHFMNIYNKTTKECLIIDAREQAPNAARENMYDHQGNLSEIGWLAIAVPGEIYGLYKAYEMRGSKKIPWRDLVTPSADLCHYGHPVSGKLASVLQEKPEQDLLLSQPSMTSLVKNPETNDWYKEGDILRRPLLAQTLYDLANAKDPIEWFYNSKFTEAMVEEFKQNGGILTLEDFRSYTAKIGEKERPVITTMVTDDLEGCGPPPPSSAAVTLSILNIMKGHDIGAKDMKDFETEVDVYHKLLETMKFAYGRRTTLGDFTFEPKALDIARNITSEWFAKEVREKTKGVAQEQKDYNPELVAGTPDNHGTSNIAVLDAEGNAVCITTTINLYFGSKIHSLKTGILWNDQMDDFSKPNVSNAFDLPPSIPNYIKPGKRPMSSMSPIVIYNKKSGEVKMVIGSEGGSRIISAVAQVAMRLLWFGQNVKEAVDAPRLHNQFVGQSEYEINPRFPQEYIDVLTNKHKQNFTTKGFGFPTTVTVIFRSDKGRVHANSDFRKAGGYPAGI